MNDILILSNKAEYMSVCFEKLKAPDIILYGVKYNNVFKVVKDKNDVFMGAYFINEKELMNFLN